MANSPSGDSMISRVVRIISAFGTDHPSMSIAALARRVDIPLATTHRIVNELIRYELIQRDPNGDVRIGLRMWELGNRGSRALDLREVARPYMEDIQAVVRQHTQLAILRDGEALFIERLSGRGSVVNKAQIAGRLPAHVSSSGQVLLAYAPRHVREEYLKRPLEKMTPNTVTDPEELRRQFAEIRRRGYAVLPGFVVPDTTAVAVPVLDERRNAIAALGVVVATGEENIQAMVPALSTAARAIGRDMSARLPA